MTTAPEPITLESSTMLDRLLPLFRIELLTIEFLMTHPSATVTYGPMTEFSRRLPGST